MRLLLYLAIGLLALSPFARADEPRVLDGNYRLELVANEPDIVTPIGIVFDAKGRLLVIESHTHFQPPEYKGPKKDRIRIIEDTNGDGKADRFTTFYEGSSSTMSLACAANGTVYVATRAKIFTLRDRNGDGKVDEEKTLVRLQTPGDYPHNGLCGLCFDRQGMFYFGLGENLGEPYKLVGRDGIVLAGGGEGGNIYRCRPDGSSLQRLATGLWNPFGICIDAHGRMSAVENDPDGRPPCRLLHIVPGGDYGYQFRYGRSGRHPLQAWNGELPGTLPMVAGTGEAPSAVVPYHGDLWVTSWGDHRIERYALKPMGASWRAEATNVVQGDKDFRPVGFALAPDGSLYFTDWVDQSYPVHGKGRIWRLVPTKNAPKDRELPPLTREEKQARKLQSTADLEALKTEDPFLHQAAVWGLVVHGQPEKLDWRSLKDPQQRLGLLQALRLRNSKADSILSQALSDPDPRIRLFAIRWVADERLSTYRDQVLAQLKRTDGSFALHKAAMATLLWLDAGKIGSAKNIHDPTGIYLSFLDSDDFPAAVRAWALRSMAPDHPALTLPRIQALLKSDDAEVKREAVWTLALSRKPKRFDLLQEIALDAAFPEMLRADAVMGLAEDGLRRKEVLLNLAKVDSKAIREEAQRSLRGVVNALPEGSEELPAATDLDQWLKLVDRPGDADAGQRVFFGTKAGNCARCHSFAGRGMELGPDLTGIGQKLTRQRLLESLLQPSREIAPQYRTWLVELRDGRTMTAMSLGSTGDERLEKFLGTDGSVFDLHKSAIQAKHASSLSIMPQGLESTMTVKEIRDLLAFLMTER